MINNIHITHAMVITFWLTSVYYTQPNRPLYYRINVGTVELASSITEESQMVTFI